MKPHADSKLKTLPPDRQEALVDYLRTHTLVETRKWLAADGLSTSTRALSDFLSWYQLRSIFRDTERDSLNFMEQMKQSLPKFSPEDLAQMGETFFNFQAMKGADPEQFLAFQTARHRAKMDVLKLEQRERQIALEERRIKLLEEKARQADDADATLRNPDLTPEEKQARMRQIFGIP